MAFFRNLFGFTHGKQDATQMGQKRQVVIVIRVGHGSPESIGRAIIEVRGLIGGVSS
jgi:hypothetical protein